jgi:hypothetical protein
MIRPRRTLGILALTSCFAGCGGGGAPHASARLDGRFVLESEPSSGTFAVTPLVAKADRDIADLIGHPLRFTFSAAIVPKWQDDLESLSASAIASVARELAQLKERRPTMFAWVAPQLRRVEWDYSATAEHPSYALDARSGVLRIVLTSDSVRVVDDDEIRFAIGRAYASFLGGRFLKVDPGAVAEGDRAAYSEWLLEFGYGAEKEARAAKPEEAAVDPPRARTLSKLLRFEAAVRGTKPPFEKDLVDAILSEGKWLAQTRRSDNPAVAKLSADSDFARAEAAFAAWLSANVDGLPDAAQLAIAEDIQTSTADDGQVRAYLGFDRVAWFERTLDRWIRAGKPVGEGPDAQQDTRRLYELVLGAYELQDGDGGCRDQRRAVYLGVKRDPALRKRIFDDFLRRRDPFVTSTLMANLMGLDDPEPAIAFWHATEADDAQFRATTRPLAAHVDRCQSWDKVYDDLPRLWKAYPARHGVLLHLIYKFGTENYRENFARIFGALSQADFAAFLDQETDPYREVLNAWRDLGPGWSRMDVIGPRLDRWLTEDYRKNNSWWGQNAGFIAEHLCVEKNLGDLQKLHAWVDRRIAAHASEIDPLKDAEDKSAPGACRR